MNYYTRRECSQVAAMVSNTVPLFGQMPRTCVLDVMALFQVLGAVARCASWKTLCTLRLLSLTAEAATRPHVRRRAIVCWEPARAAHQWRFAPRALAVGSGDMLTKPLIHDIVRLRIEVLRFSTLISRDCKFMPWLPDTVRELSLIKCEVPVRLADVLPTPLLALHVNCCYTAESDPISLAGLPPTLRRLCVEDTPVALPLAESNADAERDAFWRLPRLEYLELDDCLRLRGDDDEEEGDDDSVDSSDNELPTRYCRMPAGLLHLSVHKYSHTYGPFAFVVPSSVTLLRSGGNVVPLFPDLLAPALQTLDALDLWNTGIEVKSSDEDRGADLGTAKRFLAQLERLHAPCLRTVEYPAVIGTEYRVTVPPLLVPAPLTYLVPPGTFQSGIDLLPATLEVLDIRHDYDRRLLSHRGAVAPPRLRVLALGPTFNSPLIGLPPSLRTLVLGDAFRRSLRHLPPQLEVLILGKAFDDSFADLPCAATLHSLMLMNDRWSEPLAASISLPALRRVVGSVPAYHSLIALLAIPPIAIPAFEPTDATYSILDDCSGLLQDLKQRRYVALPEVDWHYQ